MLNLPRCPKRISRKEKLKLLTSDRFLEEYNKWIQEHDFDLNSLMNELKALGYPTSMKVDIKHALLNRKIWKKDGKLRCICGFRTDDNRFMTGHRLICKEYKAYQDKVLDINILREKLQHMTVMEYCEKYVDMEVLPYHNCLHVIKKYVKDGLLDYDFSVNPMQRESVKKRFKEKMIEKYGVENPSQVEEVKEIKRQKQLKYWNQHKLQHAQKIFESKGVFNIKQDPEKIKQLLHAINASTYEELLKHAYNLLTNNEYVEWIENLSFEAFYNTKLGEGKNTFKFKCKNCGCIFSKYISSPEMLLHHIYIEKFLLQDIIACPACRNYGKSKYEHQIVAKVQSHIPNVEVQTSVKINKNYEVDIVLSYNNKSIGVEYDGIFWHSTAKMRAFAKDYMDFKNKLFKHRQLLKDKFAQYQLLNYKILTIDEYSWITHQDFWISKILYELDALNNKTYARNCQIKELDNNTANEFHGKYNLHGPIVGAIANVALVYNNELVQVISVNKCSARQGVIHNANVEYELSRITTKPYYVISGGMYRLIAYLKQKLNTESFITFVDSRLSSKPPEYAKQILTKPQLTYFIVDYNNKCLRHRLFIRRLIGNQNITEEEYIFITPDYDIFVTYGSWKILI